MEDLNQWLPLLLKLAGWAQITLIIGSLGIPTVLEWRSKLSGLSTLTRQMFWVYSFYIWVTNLCFGLVSAFGAQHLLDSSPLATCVTGFIFGYWFIRMIVQWTYFDISEIPQTGFTIAARWALEILFMGLMLIYLACVLANLGLV